MISILIVSNSNEPCEVYMDASSIDLGFFLWSIIVKLWLVLIIN